MKDSAHFVFHVNNKAIDASLYQLNISYSLSHFIYQDEGLGEVSQENLL